MTAFNFQSVLDAFLSQRPFRRFVIELNSGTRLLIPHPETISVRDGLAVFHPIEEISRLFFFDHDCVCPLAEPKESPEKQVPED